jgi:hypothetical protein
MGQKGSDDPFAAAAVGAVGASAASWVVPVRASPVVCPVVSMESIKPPVIFTAEPVPVQPLERSLVKTISSADST